eukprot:1085638-Rhodomonas_salina.2
MPYGSMPGSRRWTTGSGVPPALGGKSVWSVGGNSDEAGRVTRMMSPGAKTIRSASQPRPLGIDCFRAPRPGTTPQATSELGGAKHCHRESAQTPTRSLILCSWSWVENFIPVTTSTGVFFCELNASTSFDNPPAITTTPSSVVDVAREQHHSQSHSQMSHKSANTRRISTRHCGERV